MSDFPSHLRRYRLILVHEHDHSYPYFARSNLTELLRKALQGEDIGIVVDGKIVALRPVTVESTDYPMREYGATSIDLKNFEARIHGQVKKARTKGRLHPFTGEIEDLIGSKDH